MSFDALWRLKRRTFDPSELRNAVEEVARELGVARVEWREGRETERLDAFLWLPAALVQAHDLPGFGKTPEAVDLFPTRLEFSLDPGGPGPLDVSEFSQEEGEMLFDMAFSADPAHTAGGVAVGSAFFLSRHSSWQALSSPSIPDTEDNYLCSVRWGRNGELWIGTEDGALYRVSRGEWTRFEVANDSIDSICVLSPTRILLGAANGDIIEFDGEKVARRWRGLSTQWLVDTAEGPVQYGSEVLRRLEGGEWRKVQLPPDFFVFGLAVDCRRRLWLANHEAVFLLEGSQLIPTPVHCDSVEALAVHDENDIWVVGNGGEIIHWDGKAMERAQCGQEGGSTLVTDGRGRAWILFTRMVAVRLSRGVSLHISSKRDSNREAWGALGEFCARVASRLDGYIVG